MMISSLLESCNLFEKLAQIQSESEEENPFLDQKLNPQISQKDIDDISRFKKSLSNEFWKKFLEMAEEISNDKSKEAVLKVAELIAKVISDESGFDPHQVAIRNGHPVAKGLNQMLKTTAIDMGMTAQQWDDLDKPNGLSAIEQLPFVEKFFKRMGVKPTDSKESLHSKNFGGYHGTNPKSIEGNAISYASKAYIDQVDPEHKRFTNPDFQDKAYRQNIDLDIILGPDGKLLLDSNGRPRRKGYISPSDLSEKASAARRALVTKRKT
jgi:predicted house-cleaning noncanonical NTP pyrophosphatase (MazG superfamily)